MKKSILILSLFLIINPVMAFQSYDPNTGTYVDIQNDKNDIYQGQLINVFDYNTGQYKLYNVDYVDDRSIKVNTPCEPDEDKRTFEINEF